MCAGKIYMNTDLFFYLYIFCSYGIRVYEAMGISVSLSCLIFGDFPPYVCSYCSVLFCIIFSSVWVGEWPPLGK